MPELRVVKLCQENYKSQLKLVFSAKLSKTFWEFKRFKVDSRAGGNPDSFVTPAKPGSGAITCIPFSNGMTDAVRHLDAGWSLS